MDNEYVKYEVDNIKTTADLKAKVAAFETLYGKCEVYVKGHWFYPQGEKDLALNFEYTWVRVSNIGNKYLTLDLDNGYKVLPHDKYGDAGIYGIRIMQV